MCLKCRSNGEVGLHSCGRVWGREAELVDVNLSPTPSPCEGDREHRLESKSAASNCSRTRSASSCILHRTSLSLSLSLSASLSLSTSRSKDAEHTSRYAAAGPVAAAVPVARRSRNRSSRSLEHCRRCYRRVCPPSVRCKTTAIYLSHNSTLARTQTHRDLRHQLRHLKYFTVFQGTRPLSQTALRYVRRRRRPVVLEAPHTSPLGDQLRQIL